MRFIGGVVRATAPITSSGGSGNGAAGGAGGPIWITSTQSSSSVAAVTAKDGAGTPPGAAGTITIDGAPL